MVAAPVSPLERQQLESALAGEATYWHRIRFELVGRRGRTAATRAALLDIGAGAGLLGTWVATERPDLRVPLRGDRRPCCATTSSAASARPPRSIPTTPVPAGTMVTMLDVLEHIEDAAGALGGAPRPDAGRRAGRRHRAGDAMGVLVVGHRARSPPPLLAARGLRDDLTAAGFDVRSPSTYLFPELFPLLVVRRLRRAPRRAGRLPGALAGARRRSATPSRGRRRRPAGCGRSARRWWPSPPAARDERVRASDDQARSSAGAPTPAGNRAAPRQGAPVSEPAGTARRRPRCGSCARCCATPSRTSGCTTRCSSACRADGWTGRGALRRRRRLGGHRPRGRPARRPTPTSPC